MISYVYFIEKQLLPRAFIHRDDFDYILQLYARSASTYNGEFYMAAAATITILPRTLPPHS